MSPARRQLLAVALALALGGAGAAAPRPAPEPTGAGAEGPLGPGRRPSVVAGEVTTERFRILYTERAHAAAKALALDVERARADFVRIFGRDFPGVTELRLGVGRDELEALALPGAPPPRWAAAVAYPARGVILLEAGSMLGGSGPGTLRHELVHVALGRLGGGAWPHWFQEGMAEQLSPSRFEPGHYMAIFRAVRQDRIFELDALTGAWPEHPADVELAYAQSSSFVAFLAERHGAARFGELIDKVAQGMPFETAFAQAFRTSLRLEEGAWKSHLPDRYSWLPLAGLSSFTWLGASILCVAAFVRRRRSVARYRAELAAEEAAFDAAQRILEAEAKEQPGAEPVEEFPPGEAPDEDEDTGEKPKPTLH